MSVLQKYDLTNRSLFTGLAMETKERIERKPCNRTFKR